MNCLRVQLVPETHHGKTNNLHMRKQRRRAASTLTLNNHIHVISLFMLFSTLHLPIFRWQAKKLSEKTLLTFFPIENPTVYVNN